ncbi:MAG: DNA repair protein RecN [Nitratireductor sp.]|nr:DNA repair protein RecN [Nitratireductor sp.]
MLLSLSIRDIVLIERLDLDFPAGLCVLTGETGAGKSILLDALSLALGARGDGALVRSGASQGQVTAVFEPGERHPSFAILAENGISEEGQLILRRSQGADGRTRAFVNDQPVSASLLRDIGRSLVEIHGQHDDRALVDSSAHRSLLDAFGMLEADAALTSAAWNSWRKALGELNALTAQVEAGARERDYLKASLDELNALSPEPGEEERLAEQRSRMMKVEKIAGELHEASEQLSGQASPIPGLSSLLRRLERKAADMRDVLGGAVEALDQGVNALLVAAQELERALRETEFDPQALERSEERLFALRAASRKFSVPVDDLPALAVRFADALSTIDAGGERMAALAKQSAELESEYRRLAGTLSRKRREAGEALSAAVAQELPALKLERAQFIVQSGETEPGPHGVDSVEFWVQTNPGTRPGPMMKVASGGELARFLLALKVSLADRGSAPTLVFDEIDSGVGGAVADAIGRRLARLASKVQVLSVTHAPQIAARAGEHFLISKDAVEGSGRVATAVSRIEGGERREEIARMLAGATITEEARAAAEKLISQTAA